MKYSNIGGQAVMEGIMMKNGDHYAVAVRKPDKEIEVKVEECHSFIKNKKILQLPFIRRVQLCGFAGPGYEEPDVFRGVFHG